MNHFPISVNLSRKTVYLIGDGPQIRQKAEKMKPFEAVLTHKQTFTEADARTAPAMVIVGGHGCCESRRNCFTVRTIPYPGQCGGCAAALQLLLSRTDHQGGSDRVHIHGRNLSCGCCVFTGTN